MKQFIYYYLRSMRLYYCFVTGATTCYGVALWVNQRHLAQQSVNCREWLSIALVLLIGFLSWGVNQIFSDYCDRREDAVNAPHRPMVTGALPAKPAMMLSGTVMFAFGVIGYCLNPWCLAILACGGLLNIAYSILKKIPVLNCLIYACSISCCALFGYTAMEVTAPAMDMLQRVAIYILPAHFLMCHNSYYKDVEGDREAGIRTLQVVFPEKLSIAVSLCVALAANAIIITALVSNSQLCMHSKFLAFLQAAVSVIVLVAPIKPLMLAINRQDYHRATCLNCQLCVAMVCSAMTVFWSDALYLECIFLMAIYSIFKWYSDEKE